MIYQEDDPAYLRAQDQKAFRLKKESESAMHAEHIRQQIKTTPLHNRPKQEAQRPLGCGLFMVVVLAWCFVACGPSRQFKDQSADVLDVARQLHDAGCESDALLQQDLCDKAYYTLVSVEPSLEDEIAKKRRLQAMWGTLKPLVWPYVESGVLTAAQLLLAYVTGNILGQALETVSEPP